MCSFLKLICLIKNISSTGPALPTCTFTITLLPPCERSAFSAHPSWVLPRYAVKGKVGIRPNKRTIQNMTVCKGAIVQHHKPSTHSRTVWTFPALDILLLVFRLELVCSKLSKIIKWGNRSDDTIFYVTHLVSFLCRPLTIPHSVSKNLLPLIALHEKKSKRTSVRNTEGRADIFHPSGKVRARHVPYLFISGNLQWLLVV